MSYCPFTTIDVSPDVRIAKIVEVAIRAIGSVSLSSNLTFKNVLYIPDLNIISFSSVNLPNISFSLLFYPLLCIFFRILRWGHGLDQVSDVETSTTYTSNLQLHPYEPRLLMRFGINNVDITLGQISLILFPLQLIINTLFVMLMRGKACDARFSSIMLFFIEYLLIFRVVTHLLLLMTLTIFSLLSLYFPILLDIFDMC